MIRCAMIGCVVIGCVMIECLWKVKKKKEKRCVIMCVSVLRQDDAFSLHCSSIIDNMPKVTSRLDNHLRQDIRLPVCLLHRWSVWQRLWPRCETDARPVALLPEAPVVEEVGVVGAGCSDRC